MAYRFTKQERETIKQLIRKHAEPYRFSTHYMLVRKSFKIRVEVITRLLRAEGLSLEIIIQNLDESTFSIEDLQLNEKQKAGLRGVKFLSETYCPHPFKKIPGQPY